MRYEATHLAILVQCCELVVHFQELYEFWTFFRSLDDLRWTPLETLGTLRNQ